MQKINRSAVQNELPRGVIDEVKNELEPLKDEATDDLCQLEQRTLKAIGALKRVLGHALEHNTDRS